MCSGVYCKTDHFDSISLGAGYRIRNLLGNKEPSRKHTNNCRSGTTLWQWTWVSPARKPWKGQKRRGSEVESVLRTLEWGVSAVVNALKEPITVELACLSHFGNENCNPVSWIRYCCSSRTKEPLMPPTNPCNSHLHLFITFHILREKHYTFH